MTKVTYLGNTIRMLKRKNEAIAFSNGVLIAGNTLLQDKTNDNTGWESSTPGWDITATGYLVWKWCYELPRALRSNYRFY